MQLGITESIARTPNHNLLWKELREDLANLDFNQIPSILVNDFLRGSKEFTGVPLRKVIPLYEKQSSAEEQVIQQDIIVSQRYKLPFKNRSILGIHSAMILF